MDGCDSVSLETNSVLFEDETAPLQAKNFDFFVFVLQFYNFDLPFLNIQNVLSAFSSFGIKHSNLEFLFWFGDFKKH